MSSFIDTGAEARFTLAAGHSLVFYVFRDGEATLRVESGLPGAPYVYGKYTTKGQQTIGPFATACVLRLAAAQQDVEYDFGASPSVTGEAGGGGGSGYSTLFGSGVPTAGLGIDGDTYERTDREGYKYKKAAGAWTLQVRPQFEWLDVRGAEILTTCNPAATWITAYQSVDLREFLTGTSTCKIEVQIGWGSQSATAKDWQIGLGTTLANAMLAPPGTSAGRVLFDAIGSTDATAKWDIKGGFALRASLDSQMIINSSGDSYAFTGKKLAGQNKQTASVVLSGATPVYLFIGVKSATNTDVIEVRNLELHVVRL
jgi:hypothetical protein